MFLEIESDKHAERKEQTETTSGRSVASAVVNSKAGMKMAQRRERKWKLNPRQRSLSLSRSAVRDPI